ncbi:MAG TPA: heavy metal-associated domain-containing protein [Thermoplasmata archaeon]|nr:heavy metal-associated domain-containing protein [Thermoplasmata archaeon]
MSPKERAVFAIRGVECASCALDVGRVLRGLPGILDVNVNYVADRGFVEFDPSRVAWDAIQRMLTGRGYTVVRTR